jgi:hypothetical protein
MCVATTSSGELGVAPLSKERVDPILENYLLALAGVDQCSANAPETVTSRLAVNLERAERAYADAAADGLVEVSADMEAELQALERTNEQSRRRLQGGAPITDLLVELEQGTDQANRIVRAAICRQERR